MQGDCPTLECLYETFDILDDHFQRYLAMPVVRLPKSIKQWVEQSYKKYTTYLGKLDESLYYAAARILDPRIHTTWLKDENQE